MVAAYNRSAMTAPESRVGTGYDLHRLVPGRPLIIGGVHVPAEFGPLGHSDADVLLHAVVDALLGAIGAGDIGRRYPDTDPRWQGADSGRFVRETAALLRARGWALVNVDASVLLERPKLSPHLTQMEANLAAALGVPAERVSVKAKTGEGLDAVGQGDAVACHAVALVTRVAGPAPSPH